MRGLNGEMVEGGPGGVIGTMWDEITAAADSVRAALGAIQ